MSSEKTREKRVRRKPKGSWGRLIRPGLDEPKPRPKGVGDGQSVNIPIPPSVALWREWVTQYAMPSRVLDILGQACSPQG